MVLPQHLLKNRLLSLYQSLLPSLLQNQLINQLQSLLPSLLLSLLQNQLINQLQSLLPSLLPSLLLSLLQNRLINQLQSLLPSLLLSQLQNRLINQLQSLLLSQPQHLQSPQSLLLPRTMSYLSITQPEMVNHSVLANTMFHGMETSLLILRQTTITFTITSGLCQAKVDPTQ
jgi:hypothetical protein